jgi:hypothetical protein
MDKQQQEQPLPTQTILLDQSGFRFHSKSSCCPVDPIEGDTHDIREICAATKSHSCTVCCNSIEQWMEGKWVTKKVCDNNNSNNNNNNNNTKPTPTTTTTNNTNTNTNMSALNTHSYKYQRSYTGGMHNHPPPVFKDGKPQTPTDPNTEHQIRCLIEEGKGDGYIYAKLINDNKIVEKPE